MSEHINLARLADRCGPDAEASWREDIRKAAVAGGAPEELATAVATAAPTDGPSWRTGVDLGSTTDGRGC